MKFEVNSLVAVYGTLRKNNGNHQIINDQEHLGTFITDPKYTMFTMGGFPGVLLNGDSEIVIEVYKIDNQQSLERLDRLEGYPSFYNRTVIDTPYGRAWMYYLDNDNDEYSADLYPRIESGDWNKYISEKV